MLRIRPLSSIAVTGSDAEELSTRFLFQFPAPLLLKPLKRQRITAALDVAAFLLLGVLFYGWAFYPPLGLPLAVANLVFIIALAVAWIVGRIAGR